MFTRSVIHTYWLDPENGRRIAKAIEQKLTALRPEDAGYFAQRYGDFDHRSLEAAAIARNVKTMQSATAAMINVSGDQRSPGPPNSAGGAETRCSSQAK
jgi:hypothetical protein